MARARPRPQRSCVSCRQTRDQRELIRLVRTDEGRVAIDDRGRTPGRGAYLCRQTECWQRALKGGALAHALKISPPLRPEDREVLAAFSERFAGESQDGGRTQ
jgi:hypothetical protein